VKSAARLERHWIIATDQLGRSSTVTSDSLLAWRADVVPEWSASRSSSRTEFQLLEPVTRGILPSKAQHTFRFIQWHCIQQAPYPRPVSCTSFRAMFKFSLCREMWKCYLTNRCFPVSPYKLQTKITVLLTVHDQCQLTHSPFFPEGNVLICTGKLTRTMHT
jgi:hypothetical protein